MWNPAVAHVAVIASAIALASCETFEPAPPAASVVEADRETVVNDREIVVLSRTRTSAEAVLARAVSSDYRLVRREDMPGLGLDLMVFVIPASESEQAAIRRLEAADSGVTAGLNHAYNPPGSAAGKDAGREFAQSMMGWPRGGCTPRMTIGVIDGAIQTSHPALQAVDIEVKRFAARGAAPAASAHATDTAIVLAAQAGPAPIRIFNADVIGAGGGAASVDSLVLALDWMAASDVRLVNISLEGPYNKILDRAVQLAIDQRMILVASSGNSGPESPARYPAGLKDVIAVTAVDANGRVYADAVQGAHIDFAAPGVDVFIRTADGGKYATGTSIAAPYVTSLIAALSAGASQDTGRRIQDQLSTMTMDLGPKGRDPVYGLGVPRLNGACPADAGTPGAQPSPPSGN
jgi:hypothetical protein